MEAVKAFNAELSALYEVKPPISKAKMTALTRGAIKAIKFYKHVVQSVEKFILKCKPEYKVPGLYVIDSIVRQSRHQFGAEKDVFAPRFSKSLQHTFVNLFKCPPEDKSKIIRVLNLWQKNQVFAPEVIQPLFDLADPNNPIHQQIQQQSTPIQQTNGAQSQVAKGSPALQRTPTKVNQPTSSETPAANLNLTDPVLQQLQHLQRLLSKGADAATVRAEQVHFDKKLLDFDYGDDEEEVNPSPRPTQSGSSSADPVASLLTNPEVLRQLQTLQSTLAGAVNPPSVESENDRMKKLHEMKLQEDEFDKRLAQTVPNLPFAAECDFKLSSTTSMIGGLHFIAPQPEIQIGQGYEIQNDTNTFYGSQPVTNEVEVINLDHDDSHSEDERYKRKRSRSRSRDRGREKDRRRRTRSRSRSRGRRHRSKSKDRKEKEKREKQKETEKDKERKKRGLPAMKSNNLSVCSTTLWVGHLSKLVHQDDLSNTFGEFGDIVSIDLISPRGCAFIVMHRRQDAARCLAKLKNYNLHGKAITIAWAPGKGVKGKDLKDYWEGDLGVSYIPYNKLRPDMDLEALEDGGMIDEDSMPDWMKMKVEESAKKKVADLTPFLMGAGDTSNHSTIDTSQPPPLPPSSLMQPPMLSMVNPFQMNNRFLSMIPNMANLANLPLGVPPPNMAPPSIMSNLGLGVGSPFQGPPGFIPPGMPPPQQQEQKPNAQPSSDVKLRNLSESLMNLTGQPLGLPPQLPTHLPPPPLHSLMDDSMDVEMEDAVHPDLNKPPPNIALSDQLQAALNVPFIRDNRRDDSRFSPSRRDGRDNKRDRSNERGRRRSRSRERDQNRDRDRNGARDRERRDRDRDFSRGGRDRDRRGGDRDRVNRWGAVDRRDDRGSSDRRDSGYDRRAGPLGRRDTNDRRDDSFERRDAARSTERRDSVDTREKNDRSKTLNDRLKEMAGINFDNAADQSERKASPRNLGASEAKADSPKEGGLRFEPPVSVSEDIFSSLPPETGREDRSSTDLVRNPSPPDNKSADLNNEGVPQGNNESSVTPCNENEDSLQLLTSSRGIELGSDLQDSKQFGRERYESGGSKEFGFGGPRSFDGDGLGSFGAFGPEGPDSFRPDGPCHFAPDKPPFRGPSFGDEGFGIPPDRIDGFSSNFPPPGYEGPPERFIRGGRRGRGRGRGRGRDGPEFFPRDDFGPPVMDEGYGPPMREEFGPPLRSDYGPPMRDDFGPPIRDDFGPPIRDDFGPPMRDDFGPPMRDDFGSRAASFREGPSGFNADFDGGPPEFFRGGPRGRPFVDPFHHRGRGRGFRGGRGRHEFADGPPPDFFNGPPGTHFESGPPYEDAPPFGEVRTQSADFGSEPDGRKDRSTRKERLSRWEGEPEQGEVNQNVETLPACPDGGGTPLRDEIDDCGQEIDFPATQAADEKVDPIPDQEVLLSDSAGGEIADNLPVE
uniref:RRM domain-containing protein n=1 Tax=Dendroctonus ponderosae TaxID=77166 RepID=A0AAR5Q4I9_DENPD